jgi:hypothetical protein
MSELYDLFVSGGKDGVVATTLELQTFLKGLVPL